jgi:hypothetical protein
MRPFRTSAPLPGAFGLLLLLAGMALAPAAQANMVQEIIIGNCSEAMQADLKQAGKTAPAGMVSDTCSCVANGMLQRRQSLDQAKASCVQMATKKYGAI